MFYYHVNKNEKQEKNVYYILHPVRELLLVSVKYRFWQEISKNYCLSTVDVLSTDMASVESSIGYSRSRGPYKRTYAQCQSPIMKTKLKNFLENEFFHIIFNFI